MKDYQFRLSIMVLLLSCLWLGSCQSADKEPAITQPLTVGPLFSDHAVLQQGTSVAIWGTATPSMVVTVHADWGNTCLLYTSPSPRDLSTSRMPSSA